MSWKLNGSKGQWTPEGCLRLGGDNSNSICACKHFSTFAVLMNRKNEVRPCVFHVCPHHFTFSPCPTVELGWDRRDVMRDVTVDA